jgi:hypothetical protein
MSADEFETYKARAREISREVPSRNGCLSRLAAEGHVGPLVEAAVEAVFNERQEERGRGGESGKRGLGIVGQLVILALAGVGGTLIASKAFPKAELFSPAHIACIFGVGVPLKLLSRGVV